MWSTLDVKKANEMLDKIGLDKKDARASGCGRTARGGCASRSDLAPFLQYTQIAEMIREQWKKIGIDLT